MTIGIKNLLGSLGLAMSAGKLVAGATLFDKIKKNKVLLVLTVNDMGPSQLKKINDKCNFYKIPIYQGLVSTDELNQAIGKTNTKAVGVIDPNFKKLIEKNIAKEM
ncbi:L7Ae/L30e/S12e/Gadd45 family ribosomal protein [Spiroplasma clarkii]|uniref:50S ribosomal protein L7Ae n=1 Tax=Spiroplasma clarkii TaxID=2139 RepID=A0A2K8KHX9_9MOLU|nr:50S ribosomal protein L7 [Spiroplasma clarkii]ATX71277.1 hypothetical protein SCLAR_v1c09750 [Spiroplasma clarkii]